MAYGGGTPSYGDDAHDQEMIKQGYEDVKN
jgi:hypothetical protein